MKISHIILNLVKQSIQDEFNYQSNIDIEKLTQDNLWLQKDGASFVTLTQKGQLRGCIGTLVAGRPLIEDIIANAKNAAFRDPRFSKLTREEFENINIEVSILSEPKLIEYKDKEDLKAKIKPNIDGVILQLGSKQATFLPQVWEELPKFEVFLAHLLNKANLSMNDLKHYPTIYTYQVEKFQ